MTKNYDLLTDILCYNMLKNIGMESSFYIAAKNQRTEGRISLYHSHYDGIFVSRHGIRHIAEQQGLPFRLGCFNEHIYICGFHAICGGQSFDPGFQSSQCFFNNADGKRPAFILRAFHAGQI